MEFTFDELMTVCKEIGSRTNDGEDYPEFKDRTAEEVENLLDGLLWASGCLNKIAGYYTAGGRIALRIRTDAEMEQRERAEHAAAGGAR